MPSLIAFGRKWALASDDFVFPSLTEAFVRVVWLAFVLSVYYWNYPFKCENADFRLYLYVLVVIHTLTLFTCFVTAYHSSRGTIMDPTPRKNVAKIIYFRLPLFVVELIWTTIAAYLVFANLDDMCHLKLEMRLTIGLEVIMIGCVVLGVIIVFNPAGDGLEDEELITRRAWSRRLRVFKIRQDRLVRSAVDDIANLIANYFSEGDYVFSDIAAGLLLVVHSPVNCYPPLIEDQSDSRPPSWMTISSARHFAHFATCVYGWPAYLMHNIGCGPYIRLFNKMRCCGKLRCDQVLIVEDNCCLCNTAAFVLSTEEHNIDLFFVSFKNSIYETPFVVLSDHVSKSIVITIRGSCSLMDLATDLAFDDEVFSIDVDCDPILRQDPGLDGHGEVRVHRGMLRSARYVFDQLRRHQVLEDLAVLHPTYQLVVCGHSLGAGVASLLTLLLKQNHPDVRCYAFAPPGSVISEEGQAEMREHVMSVVTRDDVVPRISYQSLYRLRQSVMRELQACSKAKYEILIKGVFRLFFHAPWELSGVGPDGVDTDYLVGDAGPVYGTQPPCPPDRIVFVEREPRVQLYAPGKVLYLAEENPTSPVTIKWIDPKCLSDIKLSASSVTDHLPKFVNHILARADGDSDENSNSSQSSPEIEIV